MATFEVEGIELLVSKLEEMDKAVEQCVEDALKAGAEIAIDALKKAAPVATGQLRDSIGATQIYVHEGDRTIDVYPMGTRKRK